MSGKTAKKLRRIALGFVATLEDGGAKIDERRLLAREHKFLSSLRGADESHEGSVSVTAYNDPRTYRGILRNLKKGLKNESNIKVPALK